MQLMNVQKYGKYDECIFFVLEIEIREFYIPKNY